MDKRKFPINSLLGVLLLFPAWFVPADANRVYTLAIVPQSPGPVMVEHKKHCSLLSRPGLEKYIVSTSR